MITFLVLVTLTIYIVVKVFQKTETIGNWSHLFPDMQYDPNSFYDLVEKILQEIQVSEFYSFNITISEGSILSHNRL